MWLFIFRYLYIYLYMYLCVLERVLIHTWDSESLSESTIDEHLYIGYHYIAAWYWPFLLIKHAPCLRFKSMAIITGHYVGVQSSLQYVVYGWPLFSLVILFVQVFV